MIDGPSGKLVWRRRCDGGACVEVAATGDAVMVRSSANPDNILVTFSREEWQEFLAGVKDGLFDKL